MREPPVLSDNSRIVLEKRYLIRDEQGCAQETPTDLFLRVARHIAEGELAYGKTEADVARWTERYYQLMAQRDFMPNSPTLMNAGRALGQLSACFVLPVEDSMESIFETLKHTALIHQSGGGTGFSFSRLRPRHDVVRSTMGVSSGPVSFMEVYNAATEAIKQGGTRRGANMGILRVDHPDIEEFIHCKNDLRKVTNFNLSVAVTDAFLQAVEADQPFALRHPNTGQPVKTVSARRLFGQIVDSAWRTGEPGLIFIDRINADNPTPALGAIESTNPCGEVPLLPYEACNLGSINLGRMVTPENTLDWDKLTRTIHDAARFLDNVITQNRFPIPEIKAMVEGNRKIGLGVMGWADLLLTLGIPYDTEEALALGRDVAAWLDYQSKIASVALARERGAFPNFKGSRYATSAWLTEKHGPHPTKRVSVADWQALDADIQQDGLRNATTTCIAPTGTISIIAGASGGIEPLYAVVFLRNIMNGTELVETHAQFEQLARQQGFYSERLMSDIGRRGSIQSFSDIPAELRRLFVTSHDIAPEWHVRMQAAFQEFTDNGVSKTINFPEEAPREAIARAYRLAFELGIKGITVYRNNSRQDQPMSLERAEAGSASAHNTSETNGRSTCPECGHPLEETEGCALCPTCAFSPCL